VKDPAQPAIAVLVLLSALAFPRAPAAAERTLPANAAALVRVAAPAASAATAGDSPLRCDASSFALPVEGSAEAIDARGAAGSEPRLTLEPLPAGDHAGHGRPRIAIWGDSHTAAGPFVETLLEAWGLPSGSTRPSFIPPSFGQRNVRLRGLQSCVSGQWRWRTAYRRSAASSSAAERMAKGLVALASEASDSTLGFDFRAAAPGARLRWLDIVFSKDDPTRALVLGLRVNGGTEQLVFLYGGDVSLLRVQAEASGNAGVAIATLHLRLVAGQVTIEGLAPAYDDAPAAPTVDVFSVPGSTIAAWQNVDLRYLAGREADPADYDLVLFQYGTNDALAHDFEPGEFARSMRTALSRLREVAPQARCVVIGPPDRGAGSRRGVNAGESRRLSQRHATVSAVQERVAAEFSCTFWNWQRAMGGPGAALRWLRTEPRLMQPDLVHLTAEGYAQSARALAAVVTPRGKR